MKLDVYNNIQVDTVYYGRQPIADTYKVIDTHGGIHISPEYMRKNMRQLIDLFSVPNACLLADIIQYFEENSIRYLLSIKDSFHPQHLVEDLNASTSYIHTGSLAKGQLGVLHQTVMNNIDRYLDRSPKLLDYLQKLKSHNKKIFIVTNSSFDFMYFLWLITVM